MKLPPLELRDFSRGVIRPAKISSAIVPPNSVSFAENFYFDTVLGSAVVRPGTTKIVATVASGKTNLGLAEFVTGGQAKNYLLAVYSGASTATIYYFDTSWHASGLTALSNTARCRFDTLNSYSYVANGVDAFKYSNDGFATSSTFSFSGSSPVTLIPALVMQVKNRLIIGLATQTNRSRVYFSSIVDPTTTPGVTINSDAATGDFIDVNPDDGDDVTAFGYTSGLILVFKRNDMYRLDVINKTVDLNNIFNFGAPTQEAVISCQGLVYFFTGRDIRVTNGGFPNQISRLGVQDFIDALAQSAWANVVAGTDGNNVFFSIGNVTVPTTGQNARTYNNVVLKFSVLDQSWAILSYASRHAGYCQYTTSTNGRKMILADNAGDVQTFDLGTTDNGIPIYYELRTQPQSFGAKSHQKKINTDLAVYMKYGGNTKLQYKVGETGTFDDIVLDVTKSVSVAKSFSAEGNEVTFLISGESIVQAPVFDGLSIEDIDDMGIQEQV